MRSEVLWTGHLMMILFTKDKQRNLSPLSLLSTSPRRSCRSARVQYSNLALGGLNKMWSDFFCNKKFLHCFFVCISWYMASMLISVDWVYLLITLHKYKWLNVSYARHLLQSWNSPWTHWWNQPSYWIEILFHVRDNCYVKRFVFWKTYILCCFLLCVLSWYLSDWRLDSSHVSLQWL